VLVPQFEGTIKDYLAVAAGQHRYRLESCVHDRKSHILSRKVLMLRRSVLDIMFAFLEDGPLTETTKIRDPAVEVTRHGIAHGRFIGFESSDIALKYIVLLDSLAYLMLHRQDYSAARYKCLRLLRDFSRRAVSLRARRARRRNP